MARPTSRLDVYLVPPTREPEAVALVRERLARWDDAVLQAGQASIRVDEPGGLVLYANRVGGFKATCSSCGGSVAATFRPLSHTECAGCGATLTYDEVVCRPTTALGRAALVLVDVDNAVFEDPEGWTVVLARV